LVEGLLGQVQQLVERLEAVGGLAAEEREVVAEWVEEGAAVGLEPRREEGWGALGLEVWSGGGEEEREVGERGEPGTVRCTYCGTERVRRKSRQPRRKRYIDEQGAVCWVEVERWYCLNEDCGKKSFTALPAGLRPYSLWREAVREGAVWAYAWGGSTYRRVGAAAGVKASTVYRWVQEWGAGLLPVGAVFGVVRSSGVVGVDEKYVLVPKNDQGAGKLRRWMYVYVAVDEYTYDLLPIAIYANHTRASAKAFLLALRGKGYHPQVVVTDLREDYGPVIAEVFPGAEHHECIFHFEQAVGRSLREVYGKDYAAQHPEAEALRQQIVEIFRTGSKRTAQRRYEQVLELRAERVAEEPGVAAVFDLLEGHWPKLVNAVESRRIPRTNNTVERVIGRFEQYYQNFRGFESMQTAEVFLGVFEKVYRLTPFTEDARPEIRGKCPLELAGYDLALLPWAVEWRGGPAPPPGGSGP
jgi:transposase-like protein